MCLFWFSQKMCRLGASSREDGLWMFILEKKLRWMPGTWALWMRKSWCRCTHVHVVPVDAVTSLHSGTPILCTRPMDRWIHFRTHSSTSRPISLMYLLYSTGVWPPWFHGFMKACQQEQNYNGEIGLHTNSNFKLSKIGEEKWFL